MKKINNLLLVTAALAGTVPAIVLSSCSKKAPEVHKMEIDASEAYMDVFGQYTDEYATSGAAYLRGFKFKNCDIDNIEVSVEGLSGITTTSTTCTVVPNESDPSYLNVFVTFESEEIIYAQTATFSLVFTNKLDPENQVKIDGCCVTFVDKIINARLSSTIHHLGFLNLPNEADENTRLTLVSGEGLPITDISDFIFEITPLSGASMKFAVTPDTIYSSNGIYRLNYKLTDVVAGKSSYILTIKHKQLPNWFEYFRITFNIVQTDSAFKYELVGGNALKVTKLLVSDAEITIPDTAKFNETEYPVTTLDEDVFAYKENVKKVNIGNNIKTIGSDAFCGCYNLVEVNIPKSVETIYSNAFVHCDRLERLNVADDNPTHSNKTVKGGTEYAGCIWNTETKTLIASSIKPIIPDEVTKIHSFANNQYEEIVLPNRITEIGDRSFAHSTKLKKVTLPATIETIAEGAFENCKELETVTLSEGTKIIDQHAFANCVSLTNISLPSSLTKINYGAFRECASLENITLPAELTTLDSNTFANCISLKELNIPAKVQNIPRCITSDCISLTKLTVDPTNTKFTSRDGNTEVNCIINKSENKVISGSNNSTIPNDIESIGEEAFSGLLIENINFPSTLKEIGLCAFTRSAIKSADLSSCTLLTTIPARMFEGAYQLTNVKMPTSLTTIKWYAFSGCFLLEELDLSNTHVDILPSYLCEGCISLKTVKLPNTVTKISEYAFETCSSLEQVDLNDGLTEIGSLAFADCSSLLNITLPSTLSIIGVRAFIGTRLKSITIPASVTDIDRSFEQCNDLETIIVEDGNATYSSKDSEGKQCNCIYTKETKTLDVGCKTTIIPKDITTIGEGAFYGIDTLTKITIPSSVTCIQALAFSECEGLEQVVFENPNNWYVDTTPVEVDLSNPETAAWFLYLYPVKLTRHN